MKFFLFFLLAVLLCNQTLIFSQVDEDFYVGEKISYESEIFGESRELFVSTPVNYDSLKSYPVLYILFPKYSFYRAKAAARYLEGSNGIPGMILIGICEKDGAEVFPFENRRYRGQVFKGDEFLNSIKNEVIPFVENKYLTDSLRILAGFSNSAMFANYIMVKEPDLFKSYILSSPMIGWGDNFVLRQTTEFFNSIDSFNKTVYVIYGENDYDHVLNPMPAYEKLFSDNAPEGLKWKIYLLKDEGHVPFTDVHNGIVHTFKALGYKSQESIFDACTDGNYKTVEKILQENATWVDSTISGTATPLIIASYYGHDSIVELLLQNNADINYRIPNSGNSLQYALFRNHSSIIQLLIDKGIDVNNPGRNKQTPLHMALSRRAYKICDALMAANCDINAQYANGNTALHYSIENNLDSISKVLIDAGADLKLLNNNKESALFIAIENNNRDLVDLLKQKGSVLPQDKEKMNELLQLAIKNKFQAIATELSENGAELSGIDSKGRNLLHLATIGGNLEWAKKLLDKEFDVNGIDSMNRTALHYSAEQNNIDIAKLLVENGADIHKLDYTNRTALALANDWGSNKVSKFLRDNGANPFTSDIIELEGAGNKKSEIKVTYIANMGFMVSSASKTVLIDALFDQSFGSYLTPSKHIVEKINQLEKPFNAVDLMLVTHDDGDHFSTNMMAEYLTKNNNAKVVCSKKGFSKLKENKDIKVDSSRIVGITPELYNSVDTKIKGIEMKILRLRHSGRDGRTENLGFLFDMDGIKVLHVGDASGRVWKGAVVSGIEEFDAVGLKNMQIDVAILNRGSLWGDDAPGIEIIQKYIKPKHIVLGHFSIGNKDGEDEVLRTIEKHKGSLPGITIMEESMQNVIIKNN